MLGALRADRQRVEREVGAVGPGRDDLVERDRDPLDVVGVVAGLLALAGFVLQAAVIGLAKLDAPPSEAALRSPT